MIGELSVPKALHLWKIYLKQIKNISEHCFSLSLGPRYAHFESQ